MTALMFARSASSTLPIVSSCPGSRALTRSWHSSRRLRGSAASNARLRRNNRTAAGPVIRETWDALVSWHSVRAPPPVARAIAAAR